MQRGAFVLSIVVASFVCAEEKITCYLQFLETNKSALGSIGNYKKGEIEIVTQPKLISEIQEIQQVRAQKDGLSEMQAVVASRVGIVSEDLYWVCLRDAVIFPTGAYGVYNRLILKSSLSDAGGVPGGAILPVLPNGKIVLILNYRHATRSWELELPRGCRKGKETMEETVVRELEEETGLVVTQTSPLGAMAIDTGITNSIVPVFLGNVKRRGVANQDFSEAILRCESFTLAELKKAFRDGFIILEINGNKQEIQMRDPFLTFALFQAENKGLLS